MLRKLGKTMSLVAALGGAVLCAVSGASRLVGQYSISYYDVMTLFITGVGLMVFSILIEVHLASLTK